MAVEEILWSPGVVVIGGLVWEGSRERDREGRMIVVGGRGGGGHSQAYFLFILGGRYSCCLYRLQSSILLSYCRLLWNSRSLIALPPLFASPLDFINAPASSQAVFASPAGGVWWHRSPTSQRASVRANPGRSDPVRTFVSPRRMHDEVET